MSSKKPTATKEEAKPALVPKLRFPEFRNADGWEQKEVGELFQVTRGDVLSMTLVNDEKTEAKPYPVYSSQTKNNGLSGFYSDYLFEDAITWTTDGANAGDVNYRSGKFFCTNVCGVLLSTKGFANPCIAALINSVTRKYVSYVGNPKLMNGVMSKIPIPLPPLPEQQKIASCLSSVDELIGAQARKVDALKTHKKGLMQQLFPGTPTSSSAREKSADEDVGAPSETQPRLRFPEFQNAGEWVETKLGNHVAIQSGYSPSSYALSSNGEYAFVKVEDLNNCIKYQVSGREFCDDSDGVVPTNSILFPKRGAAIELNKIRITATEILIDTNLMALTPKDGLKVEFLYYYLSNVGLSHIADTSTIPQINNKHITPFDLCLPEEAEQRRIADCLSSLDELIAAEARKLEALKVHKRGLMQQLFPNPEELAP